ncbi:hypothetical protein D3C81_1245470 [compost metagenome]
MLVGGQEKHLQQRLQAFAPLLRRCRPGKRLVRHLQGIEQGNQRADQCRIQTADFIVGLDAIAGFASADRIAQQHPPQAEAPAVLLQVGRQAEAFALLGIEPPANTRAFDPAMQGRQVALLYAEARSQCRDVEQVEDFADREAAVRQLEQVLDGDQQWVATALALVSQGEGYEAPVLAAELAEYSANVRGIGIDVRHHDDDIARSQRGVGAEAGQQLIVENLDFALGTVGNMKTYRAIAARVDR